MRTKNLGTADLKLTTVGLGTWAMGGPWQFGWVIRRPEQIIETAHASDFALAAEDIEEIEKLLTDREGKINGKGKFAKNR